MILQNPLWLLLALAALPLLYNAWKDPRRKSRIVSISYAAILVVMAIAAASPAIQTSEDVEKTRELVFLDDNSRSMVMEEENVNISGVRVKERVIASGNSSSIAKAMMAALEPNQTYLVHSDLRTSDDLEEVVEAYSSANSTINFLQKDSPEESSVSINGPDLTVPNAENRFYIRVSSTSEGKPQPTVTVDGEEVELKSQRGETFFEYRFQEKGYHRVKASIDASDRYGSNNKFYKTVKVIEKPEVLVIGERGRLGERIDEYFDLEYRSRLPENLERYYTVILKKKVPEDGLETYLADGNGLLFTGDKTMEILPVKEAEITSDTQNPKIIIGIDSSEGALQGTEGWGKCRVGDSLKDSKVVANSIVTSQAENRPSSILGVFAYNNSVYSFGSPRPLTDQNYRNRLLGPKGIGSIPVCGTAYHIKALKAADDMIGDSPGNVILVTDGKVPPNGGILGPEAGEWTSSSVSAGEYRDRAIQEAEKLGEDVNLHIVGVSDYQADFLERLAEAGGGEFYAGREEFFQLNKTLQGGGGDDMKGINIAENDHFITRSFNRIVASTSDFDRVEAKDSANVLLSTSTNRPFLTTWRYGLGRVAAFSGGAKDLERIVNREPRIVSRTLSWTIGNPQRKNEKYVTVESGRIGEEVVLEASYSAKGFVESGGGKYKARVSPDSPGFHSYFGQEFAYNYPEELQGFGYRQDLMKEIADRTGGKVVAPYEVYDLREQLRTKSTESVKRTSLTPYILLLALLIFLVQVGYRKRNGWM